MSIERVRQKDKKRNEDVIVLLFDKIDLPFAEKLRDERFKWLTEIGAVELGDADPDLEGFLFGYEHGLAALEKQVGNANIHDRPEERDEFAHP